MLRHSLRSPRVGRREGMHSPALAAARTLFSIFFTSTSCIAVASSSCRSACARRPLSASTSQYSANRTSGSGSQAGTRSNSSPAHACARSAPALVSTKRRKTAAKSTCSAPERVSSLTDASITISARSSCRGRRCSRMRAMTS